MKNFKENNIIYILSDVVANIISEENTIVVPKGSIGTVVFVYFNNENLPISYEIEFFIDNIKKYALSTIEPHNLNRYSKDKYNM